MKENWNVNKHRKRFIGLATLIFALVGLGHVLRIVYNPPLTVGNWSVPMYLSWLALIVAGLMVLMGSVYLRK